MEYEDESPAPKPPGISEFGDISLMRTYFRMDGADPISIIKFCQNYGLIGTQYICPTCTQPMKLAARPDVSEKVSWRCIHNNGLDTKRSVRNGTWFANSKLSIPKLLLMTCSWVNKLPMGTISHQCEISPSTVTNWISHCRDICFEILVFGVEKLGGPEVVVEIHELKYEERKYNQVKQNKVQWAFVGYERKTRSCFLEPVDERTPESFVAMLAERILPGTIIMSDNCEDYMAHMDLYHLKENNNLTFLDLDSETQSNNNKGCWSTLIKRYYGKDKMKNKLDSSFAEHVWMNSSTSPVEKMLSFFKTCAELYPPQVQDSPKKN